MACLEPHLIELGGEHLAKLGPKLIFGLDLETITDGADPGCNAHCHALAGQDTDRNQSHINQIAAHAIFIEELPNASTYARPERNGDEPHAVSHHERRRKDGSTNRRSERQDCELHTPVVVTQQFFPTWQ